MVSYQKRQEADDFVETMTDADYKDNLTLFSNTTNQAEFLLHCLE